MTDFLSQVSLVITAIIDWMSQYLDVIVEYPALFFICVCIPIASATVDMFRRLLRL